MKRTFDILASLVALSALAVPLLALILLLKIVSPGPVFFWSERVGRNGNIIVIPKFRTMTVGTPVMPTKALFKPEIHLTVFGGLLRRWSIDEIPQFYSVLIGHMSIVGPRPVISKDVELIAMRRKMGIEKLRPGLTGWAQINGRDTLSTEKKVQFDLEYLNRQSFFFDMTILFRTIAYALKRKDISY